MVLDEKYEINRETKSKIECYNAIGLVLDNFYLFLSIAIGIKVASELNKV